VRHVAMRRADRDRELGVAGVVDRHGEPDVRSAAVLGVHGAISGVAGSDDDYYYRPHEAIDLDAERALTACEPLCVERVADTEVHAVDTRYLRVAVDYAPNVRKRVDDGHRAALAVLVEHLEAHELCLGCDAAQLGGVVQRALVVDRRMRVV